MTNTKKATPKQSSPVKQVFESGVQRALDVFRGRKTPAEAAQTVFNTARRAERQSNAGKKAKS